MNRISPEGPVKAMFSCKTRDLLKTLNFLKAGIPKQLKHYQRIMEVTIKTGEVIFVIAGAKKSLVCESEGPGKFTISFPYFYDMVSTCYRATSDISIGDWFMTYHNSTVYVETCFFDDDSILRSIDLPINYKLIDVLRLSLRFTEQEIQFNKLSEEYQRAFQTLARDTKLISGKLIKYGFTRQEIEKLIHDRIFKENRNLEYNELS